MGSFSAAFKIDVPTKIEPKKGRIFFAALLKNSLLDSKNSSSLFFIKTYFMQNKNNGLKGIL